MEPFLTCVKCKQYFDDKNRTPRVLPCLHTYCNECLIGTSSSLVECPACGEKHEKTPNSSVIFPSDPSRKYLVDFYKLRRKTVQIQCDQCFDVQINATSRCKECAEFLCSTCANVHRKTKLTKHHKVLQFEKLQNAPVEDFHNANTCQVKGHEGQLFSHFCRNKTCDKPICNLCVSTEHTGHDVINIKDAYLDCKRTVQTSVLEIKQMKDQVKSTINKIQTEIENLDQSEKVVAEEIESVFRAHQEALLRRKTELKESLDSICNDKKQVLEDQLEKLQVQTRKLEQVCNFTDDHISNSDESEFLQLKRHIETRVKTLKKQTMEVHPVVSGEVKFRSNLDKMSGEEYSKQIGHVWSTNVYLPYSRVQTFDVTVGKEQTPVAITFCNYQKRPLKASGLDVKVDIIDESGKTTRATIKDFTDKELCYKAIFKASGAGEHRAMVTIKGKQLKSDGYRFKASLGKDAKKAEISSQNNFKHRSLKQRVNARINTDQEAADDHPNADTGVTSEEEDSKALQTNTTELHDHIFCPEIIMDVNRMHVQNEITDDRKTMKNQKRRFSNGRSIAAAFKTYRGTVATKPLGKVGQYYFEVQVHVFIKRILRQDLIFEVGICRKPEIDKNYTIDGHKHAWVVCARRCPICDTVCLQAWHDGQRLYHSKMAVVSDPGTNVRATYGFLLDAQNNQWLISDVQNRKYLYRFRDVDVSKSLWPVFGVYNPDLVNVTLTVRKVKEKLVNLDSQ